MAHATVMQPATAIDRLLMAPSMRPISIALAVPITWVDVPMAIPLATGCSIFNILHICSPAMLPNNPVMMMAATVISIIPTIVLYIIAQKRFVEGVATSGMKV